MMTQQEQNLVAAINQKLDAIHREVPGNFVERLNPRAIRMDLQSNTCVIRFETQEWMRNPYHSVHGGLLTSMADMAMCAMGRVLVGKLGPTVQMGVEFMRPVPVGSVILITVHCKKVGRKILFLECTGVTQETPDKLFFSANGTFVNDTPDT